MTEKRVMPIKTAVLKLTGEYEGWEFTARVNPPMSLYESMVSGGLPETREALSKIVLDWNFVDEQGEPIRKPSEGGIGLIGFDLLLMMVQAISTRMMMPEKNS